MMRSRTDRTTAVVSAVAVYAMLVSFASPALAGTVNVNCANQDLQAKITAVPRARPSRSKERASAKAIPTRRASTVRSS